MSDHVLTFTDETFPKEVLESPLPVLVDFWAEWCGPCRMVSPIVEELADEYQGRVRIGKVNTDQNQKTTIQYGIASIPTLMVFKGGEVVERIVGARPKVEFKKVLDRHA